MPVDRAFVAERTHRQGRHELQITHRRPLWRRLNWGFLGAIALGVFVWSLALLKIGEYVARVGG